jgi:hypothetical protein
LDKVLIIGAGFTAALVHSKVKSSAIDIISPSNSFNKFFPGKIKNIAEARCNKLFGVASPSFSTLSINSNFNSRLHNRTCWGGNSSIWGGFYNSDLDFNPLPDLNLIGANLINLSIENTGSISNKASIGQLVGGDGKIYDASKYFKKIQDAYVTKIILKGAKIGAEIYSIKTRETITKKYDKVYVCCGVLNSIALLVNSFNCEFFSLSDFKHKLSICNMLSQFKNSDRDTLIRYTFPRALNHYLGFQRKNTNLLNNFPFGIEQKFVNEKIELKAHAIGNKLTLSSLAKEFGSSIHYSNMYVDNLKVNDYIGELSERIRFFGMATVNQKSPGPISNDIHDDINSYFKFNL